MKDRVFRVLDANANRLGEALRVCEDITRFVVSDKASTQRFKTLRHKARAAVKSLDGKGKILIRSRDPIGDVGKKTIKSESERSGVESIFRANMKRAEESARVLEEFSKLAHERPPRRFKDIRFELYSLEKSIIEKMQSLRHNRHRPYRK